MYVYIGGIAGVVIGAVIVAICICCALVAFLEYKRRVRFLLPTYPTLPYLCTYPPIYFYRWPRICLSQGFYTNLDVVDKEDDVAKPYNTIGSPYSTPGGREQQQQEERRSHRDEVDDADAAAADRSGVVELSFDDVNI